MNEHAYDTVLFLRLAGTRSGVRGRHIPANILDTAIHLGGHIRCESERLFVRNARATIARLREICGHPAIG